MQKNLANTCNQGLPGMADKTIPVELTLNYILKSVNLSYFARRNQVEI